MKIIWGIIWGIFLSLTTSLSAQTVAELNEQAAALTAQAKALRSSEHAARIDAVVKADYEDLAVMGLKVISGVTDSLWVRIYLPISTSADSTLDEYKAKRALEDLRLDILNGGARSISTDTLYIHNAKLERLLPNL